MTDKVSTVTYVDRKYLYKEERKVENGYEIVSLHFAADNLYLLELVSKDGKEVYKKVVSSWCGYPDHEWTRLKEIIPIRHDDGSYTIEAWFRNPGKQFEEFLAIATSRTAYDIYFDGDKCLVLEDGVGVQRHINKDALSWVQNG